MKKNNFCGIKIFFILISMGLAGCNAGMNANSSSSGGGGGGTYTPEIPIDGVADPLFGHAWHLESTGQRVFASQGAAVGNDLNLNATWAENIFGEGILVRVSDDGVDDLHPELTANFNYNSLSKNYRQSSPYTVSYSRPSHSSDNHGTAVAGIIAAGYNNGIGAAGVAPKAQITSANFIGYNVSQTEAQGVDQASGNFDVLNMSWGTTQNTLYDPYQSVLDQFEYQTANGRAGKGSLLVKASGNDYYVDCHNNASLPCIGNANMDIDNSTPFTILVGALNSGGSAASYSSPGSNVWVSAPGGEDGIDTPAIMTTDRSGCSLGYAKSSAPNYVMFERGTNGNTNCGYTVMFAGTSAAAPVVSGVIALILEANPNLTWREVKYILAKTSTQVDASFAAMTTHPLSASPYNVILPSGYVWERAWLTNSAGFKFHNWYGFGRANVDAAVALAKNLTYDLGTLTSTDWAHSAEVGLSIPNNSATGLASTINVSDNLKIEAIQIKLNVTHADISELAIELTSPNGTKSILMNMRNSLAGMQNYLGTEVFLSNAFYQESSQGNWELKVLDGKTGNQGTLTSWSMNIYGGQ